ncbi:NAD-dependent epimerase/dehydratase family protein [Microbispora bryophytorum]|uniref:NAD-dependent epimerase/dehydratase family protein n=1 Tax=Microbispora bryophytorum subsp. camponoti TaxID=1677852 RepID=A0ABR8LA55_9ACTN|nr:NAD-dependent epimerase/dehydratase family protein [Microbispora camponoti]MBD3146340.1 NAD-dependent epimerase/dehydratase family protein [Microbispora camponoti]
MRLLVLGGTTFVGRWVVTAAVERGWHVTTFTRGLAGWAHPGAEAVIGDRLRPAGLAPLAETRWDAVVDTWAGAPRVVRDSARALAGCAGRYAYVSSRAVYASPTPAGLNEDWPTVEASADAEDTGYAPNKRGGEIAVEEAFGDRAVLARAGLILGPYEDQGRLPHWLLRAARGGEMLAPGPADQPFRYVDVRDLAAWLLDAAEGGVPGPVNLVNPEGHCTTRDLLEAAAEVTGGLAEPVWVETAAIEASGIDRWAALPGWIPPGPAQAGLIRTDVGRALATGLRCRPVAETVADTWAWLTGPGDIPDFPPRVDPAEEQAVIDAWRRPAS